jgi:glycosyltransferase involved in cell wall biosynthesis
LRILYFHQHFTTPDGSGATRSYEFAKALIERGHSVTMVCGSSAKSRIRFPDGSSTGRGVIDGIDIIALPLAYSNYDGVFRRSLIFLRYAFASVRLALTESYDVAFATSTPLTAAIPGIFARFFRHKPFIFEVRDLWPELPRAMGMKNPILLGGMWILEWLAYRSSVACVGLAPGIVEGIQRRSPKRHPVVLIPNGSDLELFDPKLRSALDVPGISSGDFVAGFTGAHGRANGLDAVLDAAAALKRRRQIGIKILLVGDGSEKPRLQERAAREGLDNVVFLPPIPKRKLSALTASLGCGLMILDNIPAFYRGTSPNKFFDYLASGIPVVNNYPGWVADIIRKSGAGIVVPPGDTEAMADAIISLRDNPDLCQKMGECSRKEAEHSFSRRTEARLFVDFIEQNLPQTK